MQCSLRASLSVYMYHLIFNMPLQGSPKCGIVGGDKIEVRGGSSKRVQEHAPPGNFENLQHL